MFPDALLDSASLPTSVLLVLEEQRQGSSTLSSAYGMGGGAELMGQGAQFTALAEPMADERQPSGS